MSEDKFINLKEVLLHVGCKTTHWYKMMKDGRAPKPYKPFGTNASRWKLSEILSWVEKANINV
jgi:predicted DNA-binding transcriptional regulator AlpA